MEEEKKTPETEDETMASDATSLIEEVLEEDESMAADDSEMTSGDAHTHDCGSCGHGHGVNPLFVGIGAALIVAALCYLSGPGFSPAAMVNGEKITEQEVVDALESQGGQTTVENLVTERLIKQAATKNGILITDEDVSSELASLQAQLDAQGMVLADYLASQGYTEEQFTDRVRIQLMLQKLVADKIGVNEDEIDAYILENEEAFPEEIDTTTEDFRGQVHLQIEQEKMQSAVQTFLEGLRTDANIKYVKQY